MKPGKINTMKSSVKKEKHTSKIVEKTNMKKKRSSNRQKVNRGGVIYLSHIPHGFYEDQIKAYFKQFGAVTGVILPRSKSGRSKGYAFIELKHAAVAKIAAETMDNYTMFNRRIQAKYLSPKEQKHYLFRLAEQDGNKTVKERALERVKLNINQKNNILSKDKEEKKTKNLLDKQKKIQTLMQTLGVSYNYDIERESVEKKDEEEKKRNKLKGNEIDEMRLNCSQFELDEEQSSDSGGDCSDLFSSDGEEKEVEDVPHVSTRNSLKTKVGTRIIQQSKVEKKSKNSKGVDRKVSARSRKRTTKS